MNMGEALLVLFLPFGLVLVVYLIAEALAYTETVRDRVGWCMGTNRTRGTPEEVPEGTRPEEARPVAGLPLWFRLIARPLLGRRTAEHRLGDIEESYRRSCGERSRLRADLALVAEACGLLRLTSGRLVCWLRKRRLG